MLLGSDERLAENDLEGLVGGKRKLTVKVVICYVEIPDSTSTKLD